ncbi:MAG: uroporphyrinogen decarboxylase [Alphaproteobacteria bacterium]|nr:uroporphyrinogen decarboxylase [Alphaproteobacteria bacterium]
MSVQRSPKPFLRTLYGEVQDSPPIWLMRQAGRYLPEYRAVRADVGGFLDLCYDPDRACEVTLQPIRRFGFDAAILFSDILVLPHALQQKVWFVEGEGPKLEPLRDASDLSILKPDAVLGHLQPVFETVAKLSAALPMETALIGFAGAPWTVATYMIEGGSSRDFAKTKLWAYHDPDGFQRLIDLLVDSTATYLVAQIDAGAQAVQLFDSWAGALDEAGFRRWSLAPAKAIVDRVRESHPDVPIIGFPRAVGPLYTEYASQTGVTAVSLDQGLPAAWAAREIPRDVVTQGNLDPMALLAGGEALDRAVDHILEVFDGRAHVFNLGHGIIKETPPDHVARLVERIRRATS